MVIQRGVGSLTGGKVAAKPAKEVIKSLVLPPQHKESFTGLGEVHRFVGELKDVVTGKVVVDPECPF
jgi:hypothetical protein